MRVARSKKVAGRSCGDKLTDLAKVPESGVSRVKVSICSVLKVQLRTFDRLNQVDRLLE